MQKKLADDPAILDAIEMEGLASNIRAARRRKGWTQRKLHQESGVGAGTIARLETGDEDPRISTLRKLGEALGEDWKAWVPDSPTEPDTTPDHRPA